jgi:hypothetical protein
MLAVVGAAGGRGVRREGAMSLGIKVYHVQDFIRKNESGVIDGARSFELVREVATAASFHIDSNILLDLRDTTLTIASFDHMGQLAQEFIRLMPAFSNRIAVLTPDDPERIKIGAKLELCMRLKGVRYSVFTEYEKAIDWLSSIKS